MLPLLPASTAGVRRTGPAAWLITAGDPQFIFSFRLWRPRYCVLVLTCPAGRLEPVLDFDRGAGFGADDRRWLEPGVMGIYAIDLAGLPDVTRVRLCPASGPARFRLRAWAVGSRRGLERMVVRAVRRACAGKGPVPVCEMIGSAEGDAGVTSMPPPARRRFRGIRDHYVKVIATAAMAAAPRRPDLLPAAEPLLSLVVPVCDTPTRYLDDLLASFRAQPAGAAELVLSDDGSSSAATRAWLVHRSTEAGLTLTAAAGRGIVPATNAGIAAARGAWVGLIGRGDALSPFAVARIVDALGKNPDAAFLYTDEVITDAALAPVGYHLKPAYDPVLLSGVNYIDHLCLYRRDRLGSLGGLRPGFDGASDYDLLLRYLSDLDPRRIVHLPFPAYLRRRHGQRVPAVAADASLRSARRALAERFGAAGTPVPVEAAGATAALHRVRFDLRVKAWPKVSIVVPSRDSYGLIARLLDDLATRTDYPDREVIVVDNGTTDARVLDLYRRTGARDPAFRVVIEPAPFNFSRQVNRGIGLATGEHVLLLNNDIEVIEPQWLREMVSCLAYAGTGIVGARLLYPDMSLQHAGVIVGMSGLAAHWHHRRPQDHPGMMGRLNVRQSFSAVTAACMLISRSCLDAVGLFDEAAFAIAYNDVDYCMRARACGYRVVWTPFARLVHHESVSRGRDEGHDRFEREKAALKARHATADFQDPAFSPWFSRNHPQPRLVLPDRLPESR